MADKPWYLKLAQYVLDVVLPINDDSVSITKDDSIESEQIYVSDLEPIKKDNTRRNTRTRRKRTAMHTAVSTKKRQRKLKNQDRRYITPKSKGHLQQPLASKMAMKHSLQRQRVSPSKKYISRNIHNRRTTVQRRMDAGAKRFVDTSRELKVRKEMAIKEQEALKRAEEEIIIATRATEQQHKELERKRRIIHQRVQMKRQRVEIEIETEQQKIKALEMQRKLIHKKAEMERKRIEIERLQIETEQREIEGQMKKATEEIENRKKALKLQQLAAIQKFKEEEQKIKEKQDIDAKLIHNKIETTQKIDKCTRWLGEQKKTTPKKRNTQYGERRGEYDLEEMDGKLNEGINLSLESHSQGSSPTTEKQKQKVNIIPTLTTIKPLKHPSYRRYVQKKTTSIPKDQLIRQFREVTKLSFITAKKILEKHKWDVQRALEGQYINSLQHSETKKVSLPEKFKQVRQNVCIITKKQEKRLQSRKRIHESTDRSWWKPSTCIEAARLGHLDIIKDAKRHGAPWNAQVCSAAAEGGHLDVLKWAQENGCPIDREQCLKVTSSNKVKKWLTTGDLQPVIKKKQQKKHTIFGSKTYMQTNGKTHKNVKSIRQKSIEERLQKKITGSVERHPKLLYSSERKHVTSAIFKSLRVTSKLCSCYPKCDKSNVDECKYCKKKYCKYHSSTLAHKCDNFKEYQNDVLKG